MKNRPAATQGGLLSRIAIASLAAAAAILIRLLGSTWRVRETGCNPLGHGEGPHLGAFWHRNLLIAAWHFRDRGFSVPVSRSRDGDLVTAFLLRLGYTSPPRGSSSRGGPTALREGLRRLKSGTTLSLQTDGPRGPARRSKPGIVSLARLTGVPITPVAFSASFCFRFHSWDGTLLPLPFSLVRVCFGESQAIAEDPDPGIEEAACLFLDAELNRLTDLLDDELGFHDQHRDQPAPEA